MRLGELLEVLLRAVSTLVALVRRSGPKSLVVPRILPGLMWEGVYLERSVLKFVFALGMEGFLVRAYRGYLYTARVHEYASYAHKPP